MEIKFRISGMHCMGCANLISLTLGEYGFSNININVAEGKATAETDSGDFIQAERKLLEAFKELPDYKLSEIQLTG